MANIGSTLNKRYLLKKHIAGGGFAQVFLASDLLLGRQVAVKVLDQSMARDADILKRFRQEAKAVATLEHPNILPVYDYGEANGAPYLVMPYVGGGTLGDRMKQGPLTLDEIGVYLDQIGSALDYAHEQGIIHRDVKPNNLLIRSNGQLALMDFGLAKVLENAAVVTETGVFGTIAYMSPEQFQGLVGPLSDIYMLGIILYQMLAGKLPYEGNTSQVLLAHLQLVPATLAGTPNMRSIHPAVVQELDQVILKVLSKLPNDRYQTCQALCSGYYKALKADPAKSAGKYRRDDNANILDLGGTIIDKNLAIPSTPPRKQAMEGASVGQSPLPPAPDLNGTESTLRGIPPKPQDLSETIVAPHRPPAKKDLLKPARLIVTTEPDQGFEKIFDLVGETVTMGRARDNQLWIPLEIISRYHAVCNLLDPQKQTYKISQLKSPNPLRYNGKEVQEKVLEHGDIFEIGKRGYAQYIVKLQYQAPEYGYR
ncbi:MAG TPA: FHA domain-containing serine/threonine-protein kinase [Ktedonobacteraceae bacterium]|nr:FHA domain-containing serine/threonine-protein kinase [Ktedonobacteraceae bacterium]